MSRKILLLILLGTVIGIGILFFQVVRPFIFPLFFAGVLAVLFRPLYLWTKRMLFGWDRIAAALLTAAVIAVVLLPLGAVLTLSGAQLLQAGEEFASRFDLPENADQAEALMSPELHSRLDRALDWIRGHLTEGTVSNIRETASSGLVGLTQSLYDRTLALVENLAQFLLGSVVLVLALYYFLADGEALMSEIRRLSPFLKDDQDALLEQFQRVCRGVVLGTVVAALVQGTLATIGFGILGMQRIWLLGVLTMFSSFIPFLGAAAVWVCVTVALVIEQRYGAAVFLAIYGTIVISGSDNLIRAYVIHDRAQMHPLVAFVTVLGALQLVGLWGIFVGPITAAFFFALLNILRRRLVEVDQVSPAALPAGGEA